MPDFVPDETWRPAVRVYSNIWIIDPRWAAFARIGGWTLGLKMGGRDVFENGATHLVRKEFVLEPPAPCMRISSAKLDLWSDNKSEWFWQGQSVLYDQEAIQGPIWLYPDLVDADGGTYLLAAQTSNDTLVLQL